MKTLIEAENFIRKAFMSDERAYTTACDLFLWHYKLNDSVEGTNHYQAIYLLYIAKNKKLTKQGIAAKLFTNVKSLKKERVDYVKYFFGIYKEILSKNITEESAISSLF